MNDDVSVIIPCYNEGDTIGELIQRIRKINDQWEIVVVDDGSTDNSYEAIKNLPVRITKNKCNLGNGVSVKKGIINASRKNIVLMDADGQHNPENIPELLSHLDRYDMVVGARVNKKALSRVRNFGNFLMINFAQLLTKQKIGDLTSGFRAFRRVDVLPFLPLFPAKYSYPTTLTICMIKSSKQIKYVEFNSITRRKNGKSKLRPLIDGFRFVNIIVRIIMLYSPQTIFFPIGLAWILIAMILTVFQLVNHWKFSPNVGLFYLAGVFTILLSLVAEQITNMRFEMIEFHKDRMNGESGPQDGR